MTCSTVERGKLRLLIYKSLTLPSSPTTFASLQPPTPTTHRPPSFYLLPCNRLQFALLTTAMRLATLIFATIAIHLLSSFSVLAVQPQPPSRRQPKRKSPPLDTPSTLRQHREPRALLDLCINVEVDLLADVGDLLGLLLGPLDINTNLKLCLCLKVSRTVSFHLTCSLSFSRILISFLTPMSILPPLSTSLVKIRSRPSLPLWYVHVCVLFDGLDYILDRSTVLRKPNNVICLPTHVAHATVMTLATLNATRTTSVRETCVFALTHIRRAMVSVAPFRE